MPALRRPMRAARLGLAALLAGIAAAPVGCGDGSTSTVTVTVTQPAPRTQATTTPAPAPAPEAVDKAEARRAAHRARLRLGDFPPGWTAHDDEAAPAESPCATVRDARRAVVARARSPEFTRGDAQSVSQTVYVYATEAEASAWFDRLISDSTRRCMGDSISDAIADGLEADTAAPQTGELRVPPLGTASHAARVTTPATVDGAEVEIVSDVLIIQAGQGLAFTVLVGASAPIADDLRDTLAAQAARRLIEAQ